MQHFVPVCLTAVFVFASCAFAREPQNMKEVRNSASLMRAVWKEIKPKPNGRVVLLGPETKKLLTQCEKLPQIGDGGTALLVLARGAGCGDYRCDRVIDAFRGALTPSTCREWIDALNNSLAYRQGGYARLPDDTPLLFPIHTEYDASWNGDVRMLIEWVRNPFPSPKDDSDGYLLSIFFVEAGLYDKAWRVQLEQGKFERYFEYKGIKYHERSNYLRAADAAYRAGKKDLAWSFLMNAAVLEEPGGFDPDEFFEPAMKTAKLWLDIKAGKKKLPEAKIVTGKERKETFLQIVRTYQKMNAHPRAWDIVEQNSQEFDAPAALIEELHADWLEVINAVTSTYDKYVVYGVQVHPKGADPLSVTIPWPFPPGGMKKFKQRLVEAAAKAKEFEDSLYRNWSFPKTEIDIEAKYVSATETEVVLETKDGETKTVKIAEIAVPDQVYVRRRLSYDQDAQP